MPAIRTLHWQSSSICLLPEPVTERRPSSRPCSKFATQPHNSSCSPKAKEQAVELYVASRVAISEADTPEKKTYLDRLVALMDLSQDSLTSSTTRSARFARRCRCPDRHLLIVQHSQLRPGPFRPFAHQDLSMWPTLRSAPADRAEPFCLINSLGDQPTLWENAKVKALRLLNPTLCAIEPTVLSP
jgi:hypothetical protein